MPHRWTIGTLQEQYRRGLRPRDLLEQVLARIGDDPHHAWISILSWTQLAPYLAALEAQDPRTLPLYGLPFAIKDNIDLAGIPTTAGCPAFAYRADTSGFVVDRLIRAGAIPVGKTNLDQFATGLSGTRSPYGVCRNAVHPDYISGGSSSGSAVAVALGHVSFALGTDTAGSGRIPAACNGIVGLKPTRGWLSLAGVVPACQSLDCVAIFASTARDAATVLEIAAAFDHADPYARPAPRPTRQPVRRLGMPLPGQREFFGNPDTAQRFADAAERLAAQVTLVPVDIAPLLEAARLLYEGPWVAERYEAIRGFIETRAEALHPVTRAIIEPARHLKTVDAFQALHRLQALRRASEGIWEQVDALMLPTFGTLYTRAEMERDPIALNTRLGHYTNFMNLLDLCGLALPAGLQAQGVPFGITLCAPAWADQSLIDLGTRFQEDAPGPPPQTESPVPHGLVVCGAHMEGLPLNHQLTEPGGALLERTHTAACYRLYALPGTGVARPGLVRQEQAGTAIAVEVWHLPAEAWASLIARIPAPLCLGRVELADGRWLPGFLCESYAVGAGQDISALGGWRAYLAGRP